jgi:hypothetical protein
MLPIVLLSTLSLWSDWKYITELPQEKVSQFLHATIVVCGKVDGFTIHDNDKFAGFSSTNQSDLRAIASPFNIEGDRSFTFATIGDENDEIEIQYWNSSSDTYHNLSPKVVVQRNESINGPNILGSLDDHFIFQVSGSPSPPPPSPPPPSPSPPPPSPPSPSPSPPPPVGGSPPLAIRNITFSQVENRLHIPNENSSILCSSLFKNPNQEMVIKKHSGNPCNYVPGDVGWIGNNPIAFGESYTVFLPTYSERQLPYIIESTAVDYVRGNVTFSQVENRLYIPNENSSILCSSLFKNPNQEMVIKKHSGNPCNYVPGDVGWIGNSPIAFGESYTVFLSNYDQTNLDYIVHFDSVVV